MSRIILVPKIHCVARRKVPKERGTLSSAPSSRPPRSTAGPSSTARREIHRAWRNPYDTRGPSIQPGQLHKIISSGLGEPTTLLLEDPSPGLLVAVMTPSASLRMRGKTFVTDDREGTHRLVPESRLFTGKELTFPIEPDDSNIRHVLARFRRRAKVVSKTLEQDLGDGRFVLADRPPPPRHPRRFRRTRRPFLVYRQLGLSKGIWLTHGRSGSQAEIRPEAFLRQMSGGAV